MGADRNERKSKLGGSPSSNRDPGQRRFGVGTRTSASAHLEHVKDIGAILDGVTGAGDAILIARTADGGAFSFTLMRDKNREKAYPSGQDEVDALFQWLREEYLEG